MRRARNQRGVARRLRLGRALLRLRGVVRSRRRAVTRLSHLPRPERVLQQEHRADIHVHGRVPGVERRARAVRRVFAQGRGADDSGFDGRGFFLHRGHRRERGVSRVASPVEGRDAGRGDRGIRGVRREWFSGRPGDSFPDFVSVFGASRGWVFAHADIHDVSRGAVRRGRGWAGGWTRAVQRVRARRGWWRVGVLSARRHALVGVHGPDERGRFIE
mmetsp:Transcript_5045/g.22768  ORF Transcript_5045/g.22768 Transcript_5045/m.22768 type:complete len:217 (-) Transcript_5045:141-791(-)